MKLDELFAVDYNDCEIVYVDSDGNEVVSESAIRQLKKVGNKLETRFRCMAGPKQGRLVASPGACGVRKDPKKVRQGRRIMQQKGAVIARKSRVSKNRAGSKLVAALNKRLAGNR